MTDLDQVLDLWPPPDSSVMERQPRKCRHPKYQRTSWTDGLGGIGWDCQCGHHATPAAVRRGRNSRYAGKRIERREMRAVGLHTGNANKADDGQSEDGMFAYQSKARGAFPAWQQFELDKLRTAHAGKIPVLAVIERPGPGHKPRKLAVLDWKDWLDLHGKDPR